MIGLAYNNYGGSIMYIECVSQGKPKAQTDTASNPENKDLQPSSSLIVTGNIHDVMK
jgi:ATP-dependent Lon protease